MSLLLEKDFFLSFFAIRNIRRKRFSCWKMFFNFYKKPFEILEENRFLMFKNVFQFILKKLLEILEEKRFLMFKNVFQFFR